MSAVAAYALLMTLGVNTHIPFAQYGYQNTTTLEANLKFLGVPNMRDSAEASSDVVNISAVALAAGMKVDDFIGETSVTQMATDMALVSSYAPGVLMAIEGGNEEDGAYAIGLGNNLTNAAALQQKLFTLGTTLQLPVINMSFGAGWTASNNWIGDYATQGDLSPYCTWGNAHTYPQGGQLPGFAISYINSLAKKAAVSRPVATTEIGWDITVFAQPTIAKYALDAVFDGAVQGNTLMFYYGLYDDGSGSWGLFNADGTPRPAATAIHNLTTLLADKPMTAVPSAFAPKLTGMTVNDNSQVVAKSDGSFMLALWNESEAAGQTHTVTVALPWAATVNLYDPVAGTAPVLTLTNVSSVPVPVPDHPVLLAISAPPVAPPPPVCVATTTPGTITLSTMDQSGNHSVVTGNVSITTTPNCPISAVTPANRPHHVSKSPVMTQQKPPANGKK